MKLVWKLLRQHISMPQLSGFFLANLAGMIIVLLCIQFWQDVLPLFKGKDSLMKKDYLVVTKPVSTLGSFMGGNNTFRAEEITEIRKQGFVRDAGIFTPAGFNVMAGISMDKLGVNLSTEMFFESVPDKYIDVDLSSWDFREGERTIPIILPRNYLNLYNFGFAQSRNMPQLSESVIGLVNLDIYLRGNGRSEPLKGKIVGFSNRLNTILVPDSFMEWANRNFSGKTPEPARLIVEVTNPADKEVSRFFRSKGYEVEDGKLDAGRTAWFMQLIISLVAVVGLLICALAFYILMLGIYLILQKNTTKLENLRLLGYSCRQLAAPYQWLTLGLNGGVLLISVIIVIVLRGQYLHVLGELGGIAGTSGIWLTTGCGVLLFGFVSLFNFVAIRRKIKSVGKGKEL